MISIPEMVRAGVLLNIIGIVIVTIISLYLAPGLLG
jgi:di/tricarboxylate transporter